MIVRVNIGGVWIYFGFPQSKSQPSPFYAYLLSINPIADATSTETASTSFVLALKAKELIGLNLRSNTEVLDKNGNVMFAGLIGALAYGHELTVTVEA